MSKNTIIYKGDDLTITIDDDYTIYSGVTATIITDGQRKATGRFADNVIRVESDELKKLNSGVIAYYLNYYTPDPDYTDGKYNQSEVIYTNYYLMDSNQFGEKADQSEVNNNLNSRLNSVEEKTSVIENLNLEMATPIIITAYTYYDKATKKESFKMEDETATIKKLIREQGRPIVLYIGNNDPYMYMLCPTVSLDNESPQEIYINIQATIDSYTYQIAGGYDATGGNPEYFVSYIVSEE